MLATPPISTAIRTRRWIKHSPHRLPSCMRTPLSYPTFTSPCAKSIRVVPWSSSYYKSAAVRYALMGKYSIHCPWFLHLWRRVLIFLISLLTMFFFYRTITCTWLWTKAPFKGSKTTQSLNTRKYFRSGWAVASCRTLTRRATVEHPGDATPQLLLDSTLSGKQDTCGCSNTGLCIGISPPDDISACR